MSLPPAIGSERCVIIAPRVFDGMGWHANAAVTIDGGRIAHLVPADRAGQPSDAVRLPAGTILAPGFIDLQVNGGGGVLLNDAPSGATVRTMLRAHRALGTAGLLPTLITSRPETLAALSAAAAEISAIPGVLGFHLEGPFLNKKRRGIHPDRFMRTADAADIAAITAIARTTKVLVTLAPECVAAGVIARLVALGVIVSIGHSDATAAEVEAALAEGATGVTHLFNAMSQMTPRAPGVVGTALDDPRVTSGFICDGMHVAASTLRTAFKAAGRDRLALVTDAMPSVGAPCATFPLDGQTITLAAGRLTAPDGTLAGAHLGMIDAVRNAVTLLRCPLEDALVMAAGTPARLLGLGRSHGCIAPGFSASLTAFSPDFTVFGTWIGGRFATP